MAYHHTVRSRDPTQPLTIEQLQQAALEAGFEATADEHRLIVRGRGDELALYPTQSDWYAERLTDTQIEVLARLTAQLNATLTGDEGERYLWANGRLTEIPKPVVGRRPTWLATTHPISLVILSLSLTLSLFLVARWLMRFF